MNNAVVRMTNLFLQLGLESATLPLPSSSVHTSCLLT